MANPARVIPHRETSRPLPRRRSYGGIIQRIVKRPDGSFDFVDLPLTPERFLNPDIEDRMVQGGPHNLALLHLQGLLLHHFRSEKDILIFSDVQLRLGPGLPSPVPDLWIVKGHPNPDFDIRSYDLAKEKVPPCFILEVVSDAADLRRVDEVRKVKLYERVGVQDYLMAELPRKATGGKFRLLGVRLGEDGRYQPMKADGYGRLFSEATHLRFGVSPEGDRIEVFEGRTGPRLRTWAEEEEIRKATEEKAAQAEEKAVQADAEIQRLRAEIERLKGSGSASTD